MKILAKVAYKGTNFIGWQVQPKGKSIQGIIEQKLSKILNTPTTIYASGRTDAGVHALGQTFHFEVFKDVDINKLRYSLNCLLPKDIHILSMQYVDDDFHARFSAKSKTYEYRIYLGEESPFNVEYVYTFLRPLDISRIQTALPKFLGQHDFKDFTSKEEDEDNFIRRIDFVDFKFDRNSKIATIKFKGNGFMRYQVRDMVGTLIAIGEGKESIDYITYHLKENKPREIVPYKAPSEGLYLLEVEY